MFRSHNPVITTNKIIMNFKKNLEIQLYNIYFVDLNNNIKMN